MIWILKLINSAIATILTLIGGIIITIGSLFTWDFELFRDDGEFLKHLDNIWIWKSK